MNGQKEREARRPFSPVPNIEEYYPSLPAETSRTHIFRTLSRGEGIAVLFGETGLGKTLLFRLLADQFELDAPVLFLSGAGISSRKSFLHQLLFQLHIDALTSDEDELRVRFLDYLRKSDYSHFFLFIDNGDSLPVSVLNELRLLLDMEQGGIPRFRIAVSGTSRFEEHLNLPRLASFCQRLASRSWLDSFAQNETIGYIDRQMKRFTEEFGGVSFSLEAARLVHKLSDGIPRLINQICNLTLYLSTASESPISEKTVQKAWRLLQQIPDEESSENISPSENSANLLTTEEDDDSSTFEFGVLEDDPGSCVSETTPPIPKIEEESDLFLEASSGGSLQTPDESAVISSLPSEDSEGVIEFGNLDASPSAETIPDTTVVSIDSEHIDLHDEAEFSEDDPETDELVDETNADLTYDSMIRERLLQSFPQEEKNQSPSSANESSLSGESGIGESAVTADPQEDIEGPHDHYMEELRLLEMEISQEANLISKIRNMHTGLNSFQGNDLNEKPSEKSPSQTESVSFPHTHEKSGSPAAKIPAKKRLFFNVFEKVYSNDSKKK